MSFSFFVAALGCLLSAWELDYTIDENIYRIAGLEYLDTLLFKLNHEHPPFSKWFGALLPWMLKEKENLFLFRLPHILLYLGLGTSVSAVLWRKDYRYAAFLWCLLYFFSPTSKAMASLHINDFDVAIFCAFSALSLWVFSIETNTSQIPYWAGLACLSFTLAACSKYTALFYFPFVFGSLYFLYRKEHFERVPLKPVVLCALGGIGLAFALSYLFQIQEIHWYGKGFDAQRLHNRVATHPSMLFGEKRTTGFWYYYICLYFFKTPPLAILMHFTAFFVLWKTRTKDLAKAFIIFALPALLLLIYLSQLNVQTGLRYFLPGILFLHIFAAIALGDTLKQFLNKSAVLPLCLLAAFALPDLWTLHRHSYLSYFNFWAPNPTQNFSDSNNDWGQGLPKRVLDTLPKSYRMKRLNLSDLKGDSSEKLWIYAGASEFAGFWSPRSQLLRYTQAKFSRGAYEFYEIPRQELLRLLSYPLDIHNITDKTLKDFQEHLTRCKSFSINFKTDAQGFTNLQEDCPAI